MRTTMSDMDEKSTKLGYLSLIYLCDVASSSSLVDFAIVLDHKNQIGGVVSNCKRASLSPDLLQLQISI